MRRPDAPCAPAGPIADAEKTKLEETMKQIWRNRTWLTGAAAGAMLALGVGTALADDVPLYHDKGFWSKQFQDVGDAAKEKTGVRIVADLLRAAGAIQGVHPILDRVRLAARLLHLVDRRDLQGSRRHRQDRAARRRLGQDDRLGPIRESDAGPVQGRRQDLCGAAVRFALGRVLQQEDVRRSRPVASPRPGTS